jgi:putative addiction module component (TIGR02574 family)
MSPTIDKPTIEKLSVEQRVRLIELIVETLEDCGADLPVSEIDWAEMERRSADAKAHPESTFSLEEFEARLRRLRK